MQSAFTLVEMLVVVACVSVLASLLLTSVAGVKGRTRAVLCMSNVRQLALAHSLYIHDQGLMEEINASRRSWIALLEPYFGNTDRLPHCPSTFEQPEKRSTLKLLSGGTADMPYLVRGWYPGMSRLAPLDEPLGSYTFNLWLSGTPSTDRIAHSMPFVKETAVRYPSATPVMGDGFFASAYPMETQPPARNLYEMARGEDDMGCFTLARHGRSSPARSSFPLAAGASMEPYVNNLAFIDGHVRAVKLDRLWSLSWHRVWESPIERPR